ncbi:MAG: M23 family metallopeptidase [Nitrospira sp.]|nr:M23 family metallopeptidase [Nitrospira sp.]
MKPNINDPAKFSALKDKLAERGVSKASIETLKRALDLGFEVKSRADIRVLDIPTAEADILLNEVSIGPSVPPAAAVALKTFKFVAKGATAGDGRLYGYQFLLGYTDNDNHTVEESYPIDDTQTVITDVSRADMRDNTEVSLRVKTPQGTYAKVANGDVNTPLTADVVMVREEDFDAATISVGVDRVTEPHLNPVTGSYQISGKLICKDTDVGPAGYQIIILASVAELSDGTPEYVPVAYATSENNGYFLTSFLTFSDQADIRKVRHARAIVAKDDYQAQLEIKPIPIVEMQNTEPVTRGTMIPRRVILVIDRSIPHTGDKDCKCGCGNLNFHDKKVFEEFSYHTVVRTTEPSVLADVIEEEEEIDLADIYGDAAGGIRVPIKIFRKFHEIRTRQHSIVPFASNAAIADAANMPNAGMMVRTIPTDGVGTNTPVAPRRPPIFNDFDRNLLDRLTADAKAEEIADPNRKRVHKGRVHLSPLNQVNWDKPTVYQAASIAHGHLLRFKQEWMPDGYSIGDLLYSLPLAPGQKKQIAVLDWERRESAANSQQLDYEESLNNTLIRDRDISEVVSATLSESLRGRSTAKTSGFGAGFGAAAMGVIKGISFGSVLGISGGSSKSGSTASQDSSRTSTGNSLQSIRDRTMQAANAVRSQRSTVIQTVSQGERVQATSESIANYNHCHAITIQYFEVLRHFAIRNRFVGAQECLFVPLQISNFNIEKILRWRNTLDNRLLVPGLRGAFAAVERIQNERESATENYYDSIGYPRVNFAEQNIVSFQGELFVEFYFFNTKDAVDIALIEFFKTFFRVDLGSVDDYKDRKLTDAELSQMVGPRTIEHLLDAMVIETENGVSLNLDITLITPFRQNGRLQISLRPSGPVSIPRNRINGVKIRIDAAKVSSQDATSLTQFSDKYMKILVRSGSLRYRTNNFSGTLFSTRIDNDLFVGTDSVFIPTPLNNDELRNPRGEDVDAANTLIHHLNENLEYYHKAIWFDMTPERRYMLLDGITAPGKANGRSVASVVENTIIGVAGNSLIMPVASGNQLDPTINDDVDLFARYYIDDNEPMHVTLPTKGVYAEAVIGQCNSCEEKDESRFWRWEESPIPDSPNTQINPLNTDTRRADPGNLQPKDFANPMVNIQNAPAVPDPTGLQNLTNLLGKSDLFRDVTGLTENQKNALATFQKSMDTAQAFGKEAADLAKTAGMIDLIKNAKRDGNLTNEQAKEKTGKAIDEGTKDPGVKKLDEGLKLLDEQVKAGVIPPDLAAKAKEALIQNHVDRVNSDTPMSKSEVSGLIESASQNNSEVSVNRPGGEQVEVKPKSGSVGQILEKHLDTTTNTDIDIKRTMTVEGRETVNRKKIAEQITFDYDFNNRNPEPFEIVINQIVKFNNKIEGAVKERHQEDTVVVVPGNSTARLIFRFFFNDNEEYMSEQLLPTYRRGYPNAKIFPPDTKYVLPFGLGVKMRCSQSFTDTSPNTEHELHTGDSKFAVDFGVPLPDPSVIPDVSIFAARDGVVVDVRDGDDDHPPNYVPVESDLPKGNRVRIVHSDGTYTLYTHLKKGSIVVAKGDTARGGSTKLGKMGNSGYSPNYHLHFEVEKVKREANSVTGYQTLEFFFMGNDGTGFQPIEGNIYERQ